MRVHNRLSNPSTRPFIGECNYGVLYKQPAVIALCFCSMCLAFASTDLVNMVCAVLTSWNRVPTCLVVRHV